MKKSVSKGIIRVNGKAVSSAYYIKEGDEIEFWEIEETPPLPYDIPIKIIY